MGKGSVYGPERAILRDPRSGLRIIRLTHYSTIAMNMYFEMCAFTRDDQFVVLLAQRGAGRDAPWDLLRARTDGLELVQMTECDDISGIVVAPATDRVIYQTGAELRSVHLLSLADEPVAEIPGVKAASAPSLASVDARGATYFGNCLSGAGAGVLFQVDLATGRVTVLHEGPPQNHLHVDPDGRTLYFGVPSESRGYLIDTDGRRLRPYPFDQFAHLTWFGATGKMQGTLLPPGNAIVTYAEGNAAPQVLAQGRYYWHSSASADARWIISDTNWPQEGLYLLHVPTGTVSYVCDPRASCSHPQWTHPHPSLSPGVRYVLFNSDLTGLGQAYLAELTPEFLDQASHGYLCRPGLMS